MKSAEIFSRDRYPHSARRGQKRCRKGATIPFRGGGFHSETWGIDPKDAGSFRVLYSEGPTLRRHQRPHDLPEHALFQTCSIDFESDISLPPNDWPEFRACFGDLADSPESEDFLDRFGELWGGHSRLFGFPDQVQGDMRQECAMVTAGLYCGDNKIDGES
jgi:hypothetical protein